MEQLRKVVVYLVETLFLFLVLLATPAQAGSILGDEWEKFFTERVKFGGYIENVTGLAVGDHDDHFNVSNRFQMNRFTILPEFNVDFHEKVKFFVSWKFVKEPRYNDEARARRIAVSPKPVEPLKNTFYDEKSFKPWEAVLTVSPWDVLALRFGRQFISWGETDGIRLLDVINPQDTRFAPPVAPNLFDLDDTRIPSWGMRVLYTMNPVTNSILDFFALPGFDDAERRVDDIVGSNDTADGKVRYGRWSAHPETRMPAAFGGIGRLYADPAGVVPVVIPSVIRRLPDAGDSWKIGTRFTHNIGGLNLGLGYIWGYNPQAQDMVFKVRSVSCPGVPCLAPTTVSLDLVNDRTSIYAAHFNYTVGEIASIPFNTAIRGEFAFYPDKPYNIAEFPGRTCATGALTGFRAGPSCKHPNSLVEKDTLRYSLGFDRTALIPVLQEDPLRAFRMSFQLFQSIILDHEDGIHPFSTAERIGQVSTVLTFRINTGYWGDTILPDLFLAYDPDGYWAANPAVTYAPPWSEKIKVSLVGAFYGGHNKFKSFGFFDEKDSVFLKLRYQF